MKSKGLSPKDLTTGERVTNISQGEKDMDLSTAHGLDQIRTRPSRQGNIVICHIEMCRLLLQLVC